MLSFRNKSTKIAVAELVVPLPPAAPKINKCHARDRKYKVATKSKRNSKALISKGFKHMGNVNEVVQFVQFIAAIAIIL